MTDDDARALEERFWLKGTEVYDELLDSECLMAFPGMGVMRAAAVIDSLRSAPRWSSVVMSDQVIGRAGDDVLVLRYTAEGRREGANAYRAFCTSTYRADGDVFHLVQHQQTIAG